MNIFGKVVLTEKELNDKIESRYHEGVKAGIEKGEKASKARIAELEKVVDKRDKQIDKLTDEHETAITKKDREIEKLEATLEVLEEERDDTREVVKQKVENEDLAAVLTGKKEALDKREARVKDLESKLADKEDKNYKSGYADGSADMARKIGEITQQDRDNAMKVAMVTAASHTDPRIVKEVTSAYQLTEGTSDKEGPESSEDY